MDGKITFGKFKGTEYDDLTDDYLWWCWQNKAGQFDKEFWEYLEENIDAVKKNLKIK